MISCLRGVLFEIGTDSIIIDINGVGFEVLFHQRALSGLPRIGGGLIYLYPLAGLGK